MTIATPFAVDVGGARITGERTGAPAERYVVFLHAGVADRRMWRPQIDSLGETFRVVSYDRRGFGETVTHDGPFSHVADLKAVVDHTGAKTVCLVGCSQGGRIALDFALAYPQMVEKLVLIGPAVSGAPDDDELTPAIQTLSDELDAADEADDLQRINKIEAHLWLDGPLSPEGRVGGELLELFLDMNGIALNHADLTGEVAPPSAYHRLSTLACPTLVMWGDLDFPDVIDLCRHLLQAIPDSNGVAIPGTAHLPNLERPKKVNELLSEFLG